VDLARRRISSKRGGKQQSIPLEEHHLVADEFDAELLEMDDALRDLAAIEPRAVQVIECRFFGGFSVEETADALGISGQTVKRDWILAKSWLYQKLQEQGGEESR